ncbi:MAG: FixH family protein [Rhodobacteraceae bacterium]|nr:FixH family protein [Paracoccaceae bacterium]
MLFWTVGFFAVISAVNAAFVFFALSTFNGEVGHQAYRDGIEFNRSLSDVAAQKKLAWAVDAKFSPTGPQRVHIDVDFRDANGEPLTNLSVSARFVRPTQEGFDFDAPLSSQGQGKYIADTDLPLPGSWSVRLMTERPGGKPYLLDYHVIIP